MKPNILGIDNFCLDWGKNKSGQFTFWSHQRAVSLVSLIIVVLVINKLCFFAKNMRFLCEKAAVIFQYVVHGFTELASSFDKCLLASFYYFKRFLGN